MSSKILEYPRVGENIALLTAWIEAHMAYREQPGLSIGIIHDQEMVWAKGFGYAQAEQKEPATPGTLYRIASITKLFTSTAVLQLRDAGKLQLDDPIGKHLDWFKIQNRHPQAPPITIRHLITHTSGLPREAAFPYWSDADFPTPEQIRQKLPEQETALPTETEWKYSNLALSLAGEIVAAVSGQAYPDYIQQHILDPLEMADTTVRPPDPRHPRLAGGYGRRLPDGSRCPSPFTDCRGITPAANMATSVEDLARFAMLQFRDGPAGGRQILRGSTLREMQRVHWLEPEWQAGWGLGFRILRQDGKTYIGHGGAVMGYRTLLRICPADKIAVMVFTNADDGEPLMYVEKAFQWVAPAISAAAVSAAPAAATAQAAAVQTTTPEAEAPARTPAVDPAWQRYLGKYRDPWGDSQVLVHQGGLVMIDPSLPDPTVTKLLPVAEGVFRMECKDGFAANGELVVFELDEAGKVHRVKIGQNYTYPLAEW